MTLQVDEACLGGRGTERLVGVGVGAGEGHIHHAAVLFLNGILVEVLPVEVIVQHLGLGGVALLHILQAANLVLKVVHDEAGHVDAPARRGVVHAVGVQQGRVVHHRGDLVGGQALGGLAQQVVTHDGHSHTGRGNVLLHAEVNDAVLADVHRLGADHRAHICHQRDAVHLRYIDIFCTENRVVLANVDIAGVRVIVDGRDVGDVGKVLVLTAGGNAGRAELGGLLGCLLAEVAGHKIIRRAGGHKVQRYHRKLLGRAALEKAHLIIVGNVQYPAHGGLGVGDDLVKPFTAVAHLHHAHAGAVVVQQLCLCGFQNSLRQHRRAGAEIVNSSHLYFLLQ